MGEAGKERERELYLGLTDSRFMELVYLQEVAEDDVPLPSQPQGCAQALRVFYVIQLSIVALRGRGEGGGGGLLGECTSETFTSKQS